MMECSFLRNSNMFPRFHPHSNRYEIFHHGKISIKEKNGNKQQTKGLSVVHRQVLPR
jgi:hypothetical protein